MINLKNKRIVLVGCTGNLGNYIREFLHTNSKQIITLSRKKPHKILKREKFFKTDIRDKNSITNNLKIIKKKLGLPDVVIYAAYFRDNKIKNNQEIHFKENAYSSYYVNNIFAKTAKNKKKISFINISSIYGLNGPDLNLYSKADYIPKADYAYNKAGMINLVKYLSSIYGKYGHRFNCVSFGGLENKLVNKNFKKKYISKVPLGRMMRKDDIIGVIEFLSSESSSYITGTNIIVDGGYSSI